MHAYNFRTLRFVSHLVASVLLAGLLAAGGLAQEGGKASPGVKVTVKDEKAVVVEPILPIDPVKRLQWTPQGLVPSVRTETNQTMHLGVYANVSIDGQVHQQGQGGVQKIANQPLAKTKSGKEREGFTSVFVYGDVIITVTSELVATLPGKKGEKRRRDAMLTHYVIENTGAKPHKVGLRMSMDTYIIDNDGCLFAAPTMPNQILNGIELKDKTLPPYVQLLQRPNLMDPMFVAHLTLDVGGKLERPDRVVLTQLGATGQPWDVPAMQAGDSALAVFWEPKEIKPGGKREFAYGYGQGRVPNLENEGRVQFDVGGSFEPGKSFTITAYVNDPAPGQFLSLELPDGMTRLEGKQEQPVPQLVGDEPYGIVMWRGRVQRPGDYTVRVRSNTGVTHGKHITITPAN